MKHYYGIDFLRYRQVIRFLFLCCLILSLTSCDRRKTIVNALDEKEANEIVVFLSTKGVDAVKVQSAEGGGGGQKLVLWDISVSANQATNALSILNQHGLPRRRGQSLLGIFSEVGLVPSEMQEKIRYQAGLAEQIASTIRKIDGVLDAEVQISFPEEDPLNPGKNKGEITASVYVKHSGVLDDPNTHLVTKIKRLVAASITGLKYDNVTVIPDRARFSEFAIGMQGGVGEAEKEFVSIWSIIIAKESVSSFRIIFFSFTFVILILILSFIWVGWKVFPIMKAHGGISSLFRFSSLSEETKKEDSETKIEAKEVEKEKEEEGEERPPKDVT
jgi:type III secretion protein J